MRILRFVCIALIVGWWGAGAADAQQPVFKDPLLDHFVGKWTLKGTIAAQPTVHDIDAHWALGHQYLAFHEISHEKNKDGSPAYEAMVYIGWDPKLKQYACLWLDVYGGVTPDSLGHASPSGNELPFLFHYDGNAFHTTFTYLPESDTWNWKMDSEQKGVLTPFARVSMARAK